MKSEFFKIGINNYEFFDALTADSEEVKTKYVSDKVAKFPPCFRCGQVKCKCENNYLIPAQVANFLSFKKLFKRIAESKDNGLLYAVCEDDIFFKKQIFHSINKFLNEEYMKSGLSHNDQEPILIRCANPFYIEDHGHNFSIIENKVVMSNCFFVINKSAALYFSRNMEIINTTSDIYIHSFLGKKIKNYTIIPPICYDYSWNIGKFRSLIRPKENHLQYMIKSGANKKEIFEENKIIKSFYGRINVCDFLVLGHPRGGTKYISVLFQCAKIDVSHEDVGLHGVSSWMFAVEADVPYFLENYSKYSKNRKYNYFEKIIQVTRDPIASVPSIMVENEYSKPSIIFRNQQIKNKFGFDINDLEEPEKSIASYIYWHKIIAAQNPNLVIKVEEAPKSLAFFLLKNKKIHPERFEETLKSMIKVSRNVNTLKPYKGVVREKQKIFKEDWESINTAYKTMLNETCKAYGYPRAFDVNGLFIRKI